MWISLFTVVLAIALGCGVAAVILESGKESARRPARRRVARVRN